MFQNPTDKYTKYFYNNYHVVDEFLTKLYPTGDMDIYCYEGCLVDNFIGYGPFDFNEIDWDEKPKNVTYDYVVIFENPLLLGQVVKKFISQMMKNG